MLIEARDLSITHGHRRVLRDINLVVHPGEIVTIVGPNGSGKTSLLRGLIGAIKPSTGSVTRAPGLRIGYVPQRLHLDDSLPMTVGRFLNLSVRVAKQDAQEALHHVGAQSLYSRQLAQLSGGQTQRVLLARALLRDPQLLMLDEPTTGLDQPGSAKFYKLIEQLAREFSAAVLMVSHELHVVMSASDRVICLNGHICCEGTPQHVSGAPAYRELFGTGTQGALALYRHDHDHTHEVTNAG